MVQHSPLLQKSNDSILFITKTKWKINIGHMGRPCCLSSMPNEELYFFKKKILLQTLRIQTSPPPPQ